MQNKRLQLFVFPYAGGSIAAFRKPTDLIDDRVDVVTVEYAGRGTRAHETLSDSFESQLEDAIEYCRKRREDNVPYALLGYSMGSVIAYEIAARHCIPGKMVHLFVAAEVSPKDRAMELRRVSNPTDDRILQRAKQLGGINDRMLGNKRFEEIFIMPMLSDYRHFFEYRFTGHEDKVESDATVFYCETDTPFHAVEKWSELIAGRFDFHEIGENHFFINRHYEEMARIINGHLNEYIQ